MKKQPTPVIPRHDKTVNTKQGQKSLVETLNHGILHAGVDVVRSSAITKSKHRLNHTEFCSRRIQTRDSQPVIDNHSGAHDITSAVNTAGHERHLQQTRQLILVLNTRLGVDEAALVGQGHVASDEDVIGDSLAEDLYAKHVGDDLFRLALQVRVDEGDVVVGGDDVAEGGEALLDAGDAD